MRWPRWFCNESTLSKTLSSSANNLDRSRGGGCFCFRPQLNRHALKHTHYNKLVFQQQQKLVCERYLWYSVFQLRMRCVTISYLHIALLMGMHIQMYRKQFAEYEGCEWCNKRLMKPLPKTYSRNDWMFIYSFKCAKQYYYSLFIFLLFYSSGLRSTSKLKINTCRINFWLIEDRTWKTFNCSRQTRSS